MLPLILTVFSVNLEEKNRREKAAIRSTLNTRRISRHHYRRWLAATQIKYVQSMSQKLWRLVAATSGFIQRKLNVLRLMRS